MILKRKVKCLACAGTILLSCPAWADGSDDTKKHALALIAPQGNWVIQIESRQISFDKRYDQSGNKKDLGADLDGIKLDSSVFSALSSLGSTASLGTTALKSNVTSNRTRFTLGYGLTENITLGLIGEYVINTNNVQFDVTGGSVGFNPAFNKNAAVSTTNFPFAPVSTSVSTVGTEGVQNVLTSPTFGYEYKRIRSVKTSGISDPILGVLWRAYEDDTQSFVLGGGYRFGLSKADDPDDLFDAVVSDGTDDILIQAEYFKRLGSGFDLQLRTTRTWQLEDKRTMRVPTTPNALATLASKEELTRKKGDYWEYDIGLGKIFGDWRIGAGWHRYDKSADRYTSKKGTNTTALSTYSDVSAEQWLLSASWSGVDAWQAGSIPVPVIVKLEAQETYKGKNMPDTLDIHLSAVTFF